VHCFGGRSRSAAFITAYLMSSYGYDFDLAVGMIMSVRPVAMINKGFQSQLRAYGQTQYDVYLAQQVLLRKRMRHLYQLRNNDRHGEAFAPASGFRSIPSQSLLRSQSVTARSDTNKPAIQPLRSCKSSGHKRSWGDTKGFGGSDDDEMDQEEDESYDQDQELSPAAALVMSNDPTVTVNVEPISGGTSDHSSMHSKMKPEGMNRERRNRSGSTDTVSVLPNGMVIPSVDVKSPHCRLSKPGSTAVRVIPPLRGLERGYCCSWCGAGLFCLGNVIRLDWDVTKYLPPLESTLLSADSKVKEGTRFGSGERSS
jgi:hypothetical protein